MPCVNSVAAVAMMMNEAMTFANTAPATASRSSWGSSSSRTPRSTTADCRYSCMYGVIVVPGQRDQQHEEGRALCGSGARRVALPTSPQWGCARIAAIG